jgi:hypothetical protein
VKEVRLEHFKKALESILRIVAGNLKDTVVNSQRCPKHFSPMRRTPLGNVIERRRGHFETVRGKRLFKCELESKSIFLIRKFQGKLPSETIETSASTQKVQESISDR